VLLPLLLPGVLAALLLVLVRTIAMFELTFLTAGPDQPDPRRGALLRRLRRGRPGGAVDRRHGGDLHGHDAVWLVIALRFVNPTQIVGRAKGEAARA
jgi:putative spermidine/putrescine transport system permease protein